MHFSPWEIPPSLFVFETGMSNRGQIMGFFKCTFHWSPEISWRNQAIAQVCAVYSPRQPLLANGDVSSFALQRRCRRHKPLLKKPATEFVRSSACASRCTLGKTMGACPSVIGCPAIGCRIYIDRSLGEQAVPTTRYPGITLYKTGRLRLPSSCGSGMGANFGSRVGSSSFLFRRS